MPKKLRFSKKEYIAYINSPEWKAKRHIVEQKHNYKCELCGAVCRYRKTLKGFEVHHKTYEHFRKELLSELSFLCRRCHRIIHNFKHCKKYE